MERRETRRQCTFYRWILTLCASWLILFWFFRYSDGTKNEDTFDTNDDPDDRGVKLPAQTSIIFSANAPVVSVGDEEGVVTVYKIHGLDLGLPNSPSGGLTADQQADRLAAAMSQT